MKIQPADEHNNRLVANVRPAGWRNPEPAAKYNLVVIGAGTAGLVSAAGAAGLGAKVALCERGLMGGDCLNYGCVPSKALLRVARVAAQVRDAADFGVQVDGWRVDFGKVMDRMRRIRSDISAHDSARRFQELGVDVFLGEAKFTGPQSLQVDGQTLHFTRAIIATGARAATLPIPGLAEAGFYTNETIFSLTQLPPRMAVIGAGPIGCELAQCFARFGARISLIDLEPRILPREDAEAAAIVQTALQRDGVHLYLGSRIQSITAKGKEKTLRLRHGGQDKAIDVDAILLGVGRAPNVQGMNLEAAGVDYDEKQGIHVNDLLRTSNKHIYAAGDVCTRFQFTHVADATARIAVQNALFPGRAKTSKLVIPWCTYTQPEIAHVGLYEQEARDRGIYVQTFTRDMGSVDRAILDGQTEGFVRVHVRAGTDKIVGATIVAEHAGEMISEIALAMVSGRGLKTLAQTIHPYPTQAEAIKKLGDDYNRTRLTPLVKSLLDKWLTWRR